MVVLGGDQGMLEHYKTISVEAECEIVIKKSRFIGRSRPVATEEEAIQFVSEVRKNHYAATHNCFAYVIGDQDEIQKQSDDGEPSGTAGRPILEVIKNRGLKYVAVVVTRYFGGVKLGAGGLIRAYTDGAVAGIDAAEPIHQLLHDQVRVTVDYTWQGKLENELKNREIMMEDTEFTDKVTFRCLPPIIMSESFIEWVINITQGQAMIEKGESIYIAHQQLPALTLH